MPRKKYYTPTDPETLRKRALKGGDPAIEPDPEAAPAAQKKSRARSNLGRKVPAPAATAPQSRRSTG